MTDAEIRTILMERFAAVEQTLTVACAEAGRERSELTLVAVTKSVGVRVAALLPALGVVDLGESRPQELKRKAAAIPGVHWHMIGHLQRNKVPDVLSVGARVHAVDSVRLLEELEKEAGKRGVEVSALLEVNASREENKHGFAPEEVDEFGPRLKALQHVHIDGLMTMAAYADDPETSRSTFREVRDLCNTLQRSWGVPLVHLSMGMSNDYRVAVQEGATFIRLGTTLFEGLPNDETPA